MLADVLGQGRPQAFFISGFPQVMLEQKTPGGEWELGARLDGPVNCPGVQQAFQTGRFAKTVPVPAISAAGATIILHPPVPLNVGRERGAR